MQALCFHWAVSFDLHVLGMPPAFILSQDQTLNKIYFYLSLLFPSYSKLTFCLVFKDHWLLFFSSAQIIYQIFFCVSTYFYIFFILFMRLINILFFCNLLVANLIYQSFNLLSILFFIYIKSSFFSSCLLNITNIFIIVNIFFNFYFSIVCYNFYLKYIL